MATKEAVVVASSRTGLAKSFRGSMNMTRPDDMAAHCIKDVMAKVPQLDPNDLEDVVLGCANPSGAAGSNMARIAAVLAGLPISVGGTTVNRFCSSGLQSIAMASHEIMNNGAVAAIGGGSESISMLSGDSNQNPKVVSDKPALYMAMGDTAEVVAKRYNVSRERQDEYSAVSQQRTAAAQDRDFFDEEIAPMEVSMGLFNKETKKMDGFETVICDKDECNRPNTTAEGLSALKPYFDPDSGNGSVTAGNASQLSDGASATLMMNSERAKELGIKGKIAFRGFATAGCEPDEMGIGPIYAVPKLLKRHGLEVGDIDLWELNEAFAVQVIQSADTLGIDYEKLNINGGSISIGHPFGMTGSRMVGTIANQMIEKGAQWGVVTMCIGGGQGAAGLFELCAD
ncbi:MAG: thiolase family protein [Candidatus Hydrogenedentota bacterium]